MYAAVFFVYLITGELVADIHTDKPVTQKRCMEILSVETPKLAGAFKEMLKEDVSIRGECQPWAIDI